MKHIKIDIHKGKEPALPIKDAEGLYSVVDTLLIKMAEKAKVKNLGKYFSVEAKLDLCNNKATNLEDVFHRLIGSLQNRNMMPSVIQYWNEERNIIINSLLAKYVYPHLDKSLQQCPDSANNLYSLIRKALKEKAGESALDETPSKLWQIWCKGILSAARFLGQFKDIEELHNCFARLYNDQRTRSVLPAMLAMEIDGMQFTLACDFLKECGYDYPKPDVHITDVFEEICGTRDTYQIYKKVIEYAEALPITAFQLDKMIWLICSGSFYQEGQKLDNGSYEGVDVGSYKEELLRRLGMTPIQERDWYKAAEEKKNKTAKAK